MPWPERPDELPLDIEETRTAIWRCAGNISKAAELLKVSSLRLRRFIKSSSYLTGEVEEAAERLVDKAETVVAEALDDPDRADAMARFVLQSKGKSRGWGTGGNNVTVNKPSGPMRITWGGGMSLEMGEEETPGDNAKVING